MQKGWAASSRVTGPLRDLDFFLVQAPGRIKYLAETISFNPRPQQPYELGGVIPTLQMK